MPDPRQRTTRAQQLALLRDDLASPWDLRRLNVPVMRAAIPVGRVELPAPGSVTRSSRELRRPGETVLALDIDTDPSFVVPVAERAWDFIEREGLPWLERSTSVLIETGDVRQGKAQRAGQWHVDFQRVTNTPNYQFLVGTVLPTVIAREAPPGEGWRSNQGISESVREWRDWHPRAITRLQPSTLYCTTGYTVHRGARAPRPLTRLFGGLVFPDHPVQSAGLRRTETAAFTYDVLTRTLTDHRTPILRSLMRVVRATATPFAQVVDARTGSVAAEYRDVGHLVDDSPAAAALTMLRRRAVETRRAVRVNELDTRLQGGGALSGVCILPLVADGQVIATAELVSDRLVKQYASGDVRQLRRAAPAMLDGLTRASGTPGRPATLARAL